MRLSDSIALGRTLLPRDKWYSGSFCSCALGMSLLAATAWEFPTVRNSDAGADALKLQKKTWPWIMQEFETPEIAKDKFFPLRDRLSAQDIISSAFSNVTNNIGGVTLDQLINWVRSVEPKEDAADSEEGRMGIGTWEAGGAEASAGWNAPTGESAEAPLGVHDGRGDAREAAVVAATASR